MPKRTESVGRWVLVDNNSHFAIDEHGSQFSEDLADAYIFISRPAQTVAVRPEDVTMTLTRG